MTPRCSAMTTVVREGISGFAVLMWLQGRAHPSKGRKLAVNGS
jgi:hypothetical protein